MEKNNPKIIRAWAFYDWANSVYPLVITTAIFPIFYQNFAKTLLPDGTKTDMVEFFGFSFINTELYSYVFSFSYLIVSIISPLLSGIADYTGSKKKFLKFFCYLGASGCMLLYFFDVERLELSMLFVLMGSVGFWGSLVFYNAFLPEIADPHLHDQVSAKGYAQGYLGSALLLVLSLVYIAGFEGDARYVFILVGLWWIGFAQITYARLPDNVFNRTPGERYIWKGYEELRSVWKELKGLGNIRKYLYAFFVYSMGVQTIMVMAVPFAKKEIAWGDHGDNGLITSVLIIQFIAIFGSHLFARMSKRHGNIPVLGVALVIWVAACLIAYFITTSYEFYALAAVIGLVMGGIQALSRATYSKMLPKTLDHASYFSFYDVLEKLGMVIGAFLFGLIEGLTSSMRYSALILMSYFIIGLLLLLLVRREKSLQGTRR